MKICIQSDVFNHKIRLSTNLTMQQVTTMDTYPQKPNLGKERELDI